MSAAGKRTMDESGIRSSVWHTADRENKSGKVIMIAGTALGCYNAHELLVEITRIEAVKLKQRTFL